MPSPGSSRRSWTTRCSRRCPPPGAAMDVGDTSTRRSPGTAATASCTRSASMSPLRSTCTPRKRSTTGSGLPSSPAK
eukprot:14848604-Alexandrium_andersonii.AAC.1